jgi:Zn-dependent protease with chaperone function
MITKRISILMFLLMLSFYVMAQSVGRDMEKEHQIESQLSAVDTSLVKTFNAGTIAMDQNKLAIADSLYSIVYEKAPSFDPVIRRLGGIRFQLGKQQEGIDLCLKAVGINRSAYNLLALANCYMSSDTNQANYQQNLYTALDLLKEGQKLPGGEDFEFPYRIGVLALQFNMEADFRWATKTLMSKYPNNMVSHYFAAILASADEKWIEAEDEIMEAKKLGLPEVTVQEFLDSGVSSKAAPRHYMNGFMWVVIIWIIGLIMLFLFGKILSSYTLWSLERQYGVNVTNKFSKVIRPIYRILINLGGIYYYISLPIIFILVIALTIGILYLFILVGTMPIQLMLVLVIACAITVYSMIRTLLVKVKYVDPGRVLKLEDAPGLYDLTKEVAAKINTRPIDEIRITPLTDLAVYERGSWVTKLQNKAQRVLILGVGVLKDFKQNEFKAVLAHEYGHFSNRDTAGGEVAMRVRIDIIKYYRALYNAGQAVWWNLAFQFLRLYSFIFRRISHGSERLQEVLADQISAKAYGAQAFKDGLSYVIKRDIEFTTSANREIEDADKNNRPFNNLYAFSLNFDQPLEEKLNNRLTRKTTADDTHPSPVDRFRYVDRITTLGIAGDNSCVRELFIDWDSITQEMTSLVEKQIKRS